MTAIYGCGFAVLEMTFIFVMLLLLHGLRKIIGNAGFYLSLGLLFAFMQLSGVAGISINTNFPGLDFNLSNTVLLLPFLAALIVVYIADGTLEAQRLIIALLAGLGIYAYIVSMTFSRGSWHSESGILLSYSQDITKIFSSSIRSMSANVVSFALDLFLIPMIYQALRNRHCHLFVCVTGALFAGQALDGILYSLILFWGQQAWWQDLMASYLARAISILLLAQIASLYLSRIKLEEPGSGRRTIDIFIAFFGAMSKAERLEKDLRKSEKRYSLLFHRSADMIVTINQNGKIMDANPAAKHALGINSANMKNTSIMDLTSVTPEIWSDVSWSEQVDEQAEPLRCNAMINNSGRNAAFSFTPVMIGDVPMLIVYGQDITERTRLERERQEWQEQTFHWQRLESIGRLAGGIAHDFNNFLHAMQGHLDIIRYMHPVEDPDVNRHLDVIDSITEKAATLTKQLLGFARKGNYNESDIELETFIRSAVELFMPASSAIPVNVDVNILTDNKLIIRGDPIQLQQALMNIMFNARDAMENVPEAKRKLTISLYEHDDSRTDDLRPPPEIADWKDYQYCVIRVLDTGTGIGTDAINRLFEPFFTTKPVGKGTGMGLSMAYGILLAHKGWIQAENAPEGGAAFSFYLRMPSQQNNDESANS